MASAQEYRDHIIGVTNKYINKIDGHYHNMTTTGIVTCHDQLSAPRDREVGRFPGALLGLKHHNLLDGLLEKLRQAGAHELDAYHHLYCGALFTYLDLQTAKEQREYILDSIADMQSYAQKHFDISIDFLHGGFQGSASPYMVE